MFLGVDCGTQGTKVVICDSHTNKVVATGYAKHDIISNENGRKEQHVHWWLDAFKSALAQAATAAKINLQQIKAIGVSGQQHGMVVLDQFDKPLYPAKLWCDTESSAENEAIIEAVGGPDAYMTQIGLQLQTGYTASKILWLHHHHPEIYQLINKVMLPHDYINYWLTGQFVSEYGDASGTGYMNVQQRQYDAQVFAIAAPSLNIEDCLPRLIDAEQAVGVIRPEIAIELGLNPQVIVASGGGDNMMGAIGTGNIAAGIVTMSLGTSGTVYAYSEQPMATDNGMIANFCSSSNGWLPLICTMNVTSSTSLMQQLFNLDLSAFTQLLNTTQPGAGGVSILPFFNGERIPPLPQASASIHGLTADNFTQANLIRATTEAATFTLRYGLDMFKAQGIMPTQIRLIGGGAKNPAWRQLVADTMNTPVICPVEHEAAALGAAIQAIWAYQHYIGQPLSLQSLCEQWVELDATTLATPNDIAVAQYEASYQIYLSYLQQLYNY